MGGRRRSFWGWGWEDRFPPREVRRSFGRQLGAMLGFAPTALGEPPRIDGVELANVRIDIPVPLADFLTVDPESRIRHTYGRAYPDIVRGFRGDFAPAPDLVGRPRNESEVVAALDWASDAKVAVIPYGGGTSVVGGVEPRVSRDFAATLSLDLRGLDRVLEVEPASLTARIQAGALGPALERDLARQDLTLRHFPQSFEFSTLGGWIATRAGGHFATVYTHIDDLVAAIRMVTPSGVLETRRLPASGAGPSPDRLVLGSEGALGVITEAWMRVRPRPTFRSTATCHFRDWGTAVAATRQLSQSGLFPSNCRLLDAREAMLHSVASDGSQVLIIGFESADHPLEAWMGRALDLVADHGGSCPGGPIHQAGDEPTANEAGAATWKSAFLEAPYLMNLLVSLGLIVDTFETACPWDGFEALHGDLLRNVHAAMSRECGGGFLSCRFTHVYPDGPAPYYTFIAPGRLGAELAQWRTVKKAASDTLISHGATITHHHGVGRTHLPWYEKQRPHLFAEVLRAAKQQLDPQGVLNPGVLLSEP